MRRFTMFLLILVCVAATSSATHPDHLSKKFIGAWKLVSIEGNLPGRVFVCDRPTGLILYDPSGHMCVNIVLKADRKPFAPFTKGVLAATTEERAAAFESYAAYFGTYAVDSKSGTITHHLENNLIPGRQSADNLRWFESTATTASISSRWKTAKVASSPARMPPTSFSGSASSNP